MFLITLAACQSNESTNGQGDFEAASEEAIAQGTSMNTKEKEENEASTKSSKSRDEEDEKTIVAINETNSTKLEALKEKQRSHERG